MMMFTREYYPGTYINGNYYVTGSPENGTRVKRTLRVGEDFKPAFPDSIDLKITSACGFGCPFCHESATPNGKTANLERLKAFLDPLPRVGIEVAIGGGDIFSCPEFTYDLVKWLEKDNGFLPRLTLSHRNYEKLNDTVVEGMLQYTKFPEDSVEKKLTYLLEEIPVGVSLNQYLEDPIPDRISASSFRLSSERIVYHVIAGVINPEDLWEMWLDRRHYRKILVLGFKQFGRGASYTFPDLDKTKEVVERILARQKGLFTGEVRKVIAFDNLAIEQLGIKSLLPKEEWDTFYQGDEFTASMYVDAVEETVAPTSRTPKEERTSWNQTTLLKYFNENHR
jgi:hypothetical protein